MQAEPSVLRFSAPGETIPRRVMGTFPDGSQVDMTHSVQMSYPSQNPQIATVDSQGIVTAVAPGSTYIDANNTYYSYYVNTRGGQLATMLSPGNGAILRSSSVVFQWNASSTAAAYRIDIGSTQGGIDYYQSGNLPATTLSQTVPGRPIAGDSIHNIYVTLWTEINGQWANNQYEYTTFIEPDFTISASPASLTVRAGQQGASTTTTSASGEFGVDTGRQCITLSASGLPSRTTASFNPVEICGRTGNSALTFSVDSKTPLGTYTITVTGYGNYVRHTTPITLTVSKK